MTEPRFSPEVMQDMMESFGAIFNTGFLDIFTGATPATVDTATSGTLLAELPLAAEAFAIATDADPSVLEGAVGAITNEAAATGEAGYFRLVDSGGAASTEAHFQGDVTGAGAGDIEGNVEEIVQAAEVTVDLLDFQMEGDAA